MTIKSIFVSALAFAIAISGSQVFAKSSKGKGDSKKSSRISLEKKSAVPASAPPAAPVATPATPAPSAPVATAPTSSGGGVGKAVAAGVGGAVLGGLAGAAIASSMSDDSDKATSTATTKTVATTATTATPSPLLKMSPEDALKAATEMQAKATEAGFAFSKADEMLKKATELLTKGDAEKKQAHEIAVLVHTWAENNIKASEELKKIADKLGLS